MKKALLPILLLFALALVAVSVVVELDGAFRQENLGGGDKGTALILYHPSRDAQFSDDLSLAFAEGLRARGFSVVRSTMTSKTPSAAATYDIIGVVSNTYYWTPDLPTLRYLARVKWPGARVVGLIGGAGSTARSQRVLDDALHRTGATVIETQSFWLWRPNDESRSRQSNRRVALDLARQLGVDAAQSVLSVVSRP